MGGIVSGIGNMFGGKQDQSHAVAATIQNPISKSQLSSAQQQSLAALQDQQNLTNQISSGADWSLGKQQGLTDQQLNLANQLSSGVNTQQNVLGQQQALANQLQAQSMGQGPNPAQQQFQQNINSITQQGAGQIASQKGISPALAAQLIAQQQGAAGQNAAANQAILQSQQQLAAQQQLAQQQASMQNVAQGQVNTAAGVQGAAQGALQNQVGTQLSSTQQQSAANQMQQQMLLNAHSGAETANLNAINQANALNQQTSAANANRQSNMLGGLMQAAGTVVGGIYGGPVGASIGSSLGGAVGGAVSGGGSPSMSQGMTMGSGDFSGPSPYAKGGMVDKNQPQMDDYLSHIHQLYHDDTPMFAEGGFANYQDGAEVPGQPKVDHNSYSNDTVKALLSPGEIVLPLSVTKSKDPVNAAAEFVRKTLDKKNQDGKHEADFHAALKQAVAKRGKKREA